MAAFLSGCVTAIILLAYPVGRTTWLRGKRVGYREGIAAPPPRNAAGKFVKRHND